MKGNIFKIAVIMLVVTGGFGSCGEKNEANESLVALEGTKWKLVGIVDETGSLKELKVGSVWDVTKVCEKCYTLVFGTDSSFLTFSPANDLGGGYIADYETHSFQVTYFGGTKVGENEDGRLYARLFWEGLIQSFSVSKNELRLYYNDNKNYLLFKSQQP
jgi:hypothetical protein